ncbi:hypothetical protein [Ferribacterium limneticum]|uniref:hypothetical protein n=1 Tax=Ferribacterium limneticum TaxID=76259 RepID=UPI001CF99AA6|nr:hypothetical protein [Ferribacterium limneticum]UCV26996.1 hypothetical protein KI617_11870 [Ferribacterium limneticum]UCV30913.1 hypothetical protein KI608_11870 [Ferribacterium limneticum]
MTSSSSMHFFWQPSEHSKWIAAPASQREHIAHTFKPMLATVLDVNHDFETDADELKYSGPLYIDFDGKDGLESVIPHFQACIQKLIDLDVNPAQIRLACSGGRGFHIEVPMACFMVKPGATEHLPSIYKLMVKSRWLQTPTIDDVVYSEKKGRMWRQYNVQRPNGLHKVSISFSEAMTITPELYNELCSTPRPVLEPATPTLAGGLAEIFSGMQRKQAAERVKKDARKRETSKVGAALKERFHTRGAALPPSLLLLAAGKVDSPKGFNQIAMQLGVTAEAMGLSEDQLITLCTSLIANHKGDGSKYNTPRKREEQLRDQYRNACDGDLNLSIGGIRSIMPASMPCNDLRGF